MNIYEVTRSSFPANAAVDLDSLPGESIISSLWRFAWRNSLDAKSLLAFCSVDARYAQENTRGSMYRRYDHARFIEASGWAGLSCEQHHVAGGREEHRPLWWSLTLRYCPLCLESLYHSYWHQSELLSHCPIDGAALLKHCYSCGSMLPLFGFYRNTLHRPYTCPSCKGPISGTKATLEPRLVMQERAAQLQHTITGLENWWGKMTSARDDMERMLGSRRAREYASWLRPEMSIRQWIVATAPSHNLLPTLVSNVPPLVVLRWRVRLLPPDPLDWIWTKRKIRYHRLALARKVYRATLRRLEGTIAKQHPFSEAEYRCLST